MSDLRDRLTLSEIIGRKMKLIRAGREFKGCCPFHTENSPSFYINDDEQFYHCFGCGAHGDAVGFVMQHDNMSFIDAVKMLAAQAGMQVPEQSPQEVEKARREKDIYSLMDAATNFFAAELHKPAQREAKKYLLDRGMSEDMMTSFRIGFAPADGQALRRHLKAKEYTEAQMIEAGVLRKSDRGGDAYSFFRERIIFPVADRRGRVVAFGGRIMPEAAKAMEAATGQKPPKYINSSDSPLFHKGRMLYGESHARTAAAEGQPVIVVEGYMDVMACFQAGFRGAVAPLGTALTEEQIMSLWKMIPAEHKAPILCFDGDDAGRRAAARACERLLPLLKADHTALIAFLPQGQDPDSLLRGQGKAALQTVLGGAISLADFVWSQNTAGRRLDTPEARAGLQKALDDETGRIADRTVQHYYKQVFQEKLYKLFAPASAARGNRFDSRQSKDWQKKKAPAATAPITRRPAPAGTHAAQVALLAAIINHPDIFDEVEEDMGSLQIDDRRLDGLRQAALAALGGPEALDSQGLRNHLTEQGFAEEVELVLAQTAHGRQTFARPETDRDRVLEGWQETRRYIEEQAALREVRGRPARGN
jgi:DNA primase